ncbi:GntR family transcriptional regulator [Youxingia wuxianensis]|uniref:GntR family transcriptional regulator n=1 Tax=Youxingia wuxianensis TaxID=2763678 RepID=A0A926IHG9_9FIRM|nr:GntR family transcriptional regulator [Youxingia wuxianensis]MBC8585271.1 GntR family transcriptional regulator [Youxingia wuxianensis]
MNDHTEQISYRSPIYLQLREVIRAQIEEGEYPPGTSIPSENELAATYGINRLTVRNAISTLVSEGLLKRVQGKGVYVIGPKNPRELEAVGGFTPVTQGGNAYETRILIKTVRPAREKYASIFGLFPEEEIYYIRRLTKLDGEPVFLEDAYIPKKVLPNLEDIDLKVFSPYEAFEYYGVRLMRTYQTLDITTLDPREGKMLGVAPQQSVMLFECTSYDQDDRAIEFTRTYVRGDRCSFVVHYHE